VPFRTTLNDLTADNADTRNILKMQNWVTKLYSEIRFYLGKGYGKDFM
jgi:hypothetical protein